MNKWLALSGEWMGVWVEGEERVNQEAGGRGDRWDLLLPAPGGHMERERSRVWGLFGWLTGCCLRRPHQLLPNHSLSSVPEAPPEG